MLSLLLPVTSQDVDPCCCTKSVQTRGTRLIVSVPVLHCNSEWIFSVASFADATKLFSNEKHPYLLLGVKSSDAALHSIRWHLQTNPTSPASFAPLQLPYTVMVCGLTP